MKKILITGKESFIGTSFQRYIARKGEDFQIHTLDMTDPQWRKKDFHGYDCVFHVAGIAHSDRGKISPERAKLYYAVNTDLAVETAKKAKAEGVGQFIFMSSAMVYGESAPLGKRKIITKDTPLTPANCYGDSKVQAEKGILPLEDETFKVVILRPPMIYGPGCKGNYPLLRKLAVRLPFFPKVKNLRSLLYMENLSELLRLIIQNRAQGIFHPQNKTLTSTADLVREIAEANGKKILLLPGADPVLKLLSPFTGLVNKAFGSFIYDPDLSQYEKEYRIVSFHDSVKETEKGFSLS